MSSVSRFVVLCLTALGRRRQVDHRNDHRPLRRLRVLRPRLLANCLQRARSPRTGPSRRHNLGLHLSRRLPSRTLKALRAVTNSLSLCIPISHRRWSGSLQYPLRAEGVGHCMTQVLIIVITCLCSLLLVYSRSRSDTTLSCSSSSSRIYEFCTCVNLHGLLRQFNVFE